MDHKLDPNRKGAHGLLLRHARRDPILPGDSVFVANLTDDGRREALAFGETLKPFQCGGIYASPIPRCMETARLLLEGWGQNDEPVRPAEVMLDAFVRVKETVKAQFEVGDADRLILDLAAGKSLDGFHSLEIGARNLLSFMLDRMSPDTLTVFVTHDALVIPFRAYFLGEHFSKTAWFPCLGSTAVFADQDGVYLNDVLIFPPNAAPPA
jgi:broad specificity phosphatase PhoE